MKILSIFLALCISLSAIADECPNAVTLRKGDVVKDCDRIGLSMEYNKKVESDLIEGDYNKKIIGEQNKIIELKDLAIGDSVSNAELWKAESIREREALDKERNKGDKSLWLGIALGILLTVGAGYAVGQVAKATR